MVVAVESWVKRDHAAVFKDWIARLTLIADRVNTIPGVTTTVRPEQESRDNKASNLSIRWDSQRLGITGTEVAQILDSTEPRIHVAGSTGTSLSINPHTLSPGDDKIIADRLFQILSAPHTLKPADPVVAPAADLSGAWQVDIQFLASTTRHGFQLLQNGNRLTGSHQADFTTRDITGTINGDTLTLSSNLAPRGDSINCRFTGKLSAETLSGALDMGEYLGATWTARRRGAGRG
jgi:L-seryl-tRNA(Ser) seleniumtransferase